MLKPFTILIFAISIFFVSCGGGGGSTASSGGDSGSGGGSGSGGSSSATYSATGSIPEKIEVVEAE